MSNTLNQSKLDYCSIEDNVFTSRFQMIINAWKSTFNTLRFTRLTINNKNMSLDMLVEVLRLLPSIESLEASALSKSQSKLLTIEDKKKYLIVSVNNKITKVKLNNVTDEADIEFIINLCRHMKYLDLDCISNTDVRRLLSCILKNQIKRIPNLCCLCLNIPGANENMIHIITKIIQLETFIDDYDIRRQGNKILLQWKL